MDLTNKVALITGGSKGIGLGIVKAMLDEGMKVCITSRNQTDLDKVVSDFNNPNLLANVCDVTDMKAQEECIANIESKFGALDVLIANAGVGHFDTIESLSLEMWHETIDINLTGVFYSTKAAIPLLKKSEGYIITIASLAGTNFFEKGSAYNASKFGLVGFTQAIMLDLRKYGIKVTTIMPGSVATNFNGHIPSEADSWKIQPEDIGQIVIDLLKLNPRTLPSKIEVRPTIPGGKK